MLDLFKEKVKSYPRNIVFPDGEDIRVIKAVNRLKKEGLIEKAILIGDKNNIIKNAQSISAQLDGVIIRDINACEKKKKYRDEYQKARKLSLLESFILDVAMKDPNVIGTLLLRLGEADGFIGGLKSHSGEILRTGLEIINPDRRIGVITSFCIIQTQEDIGENGLLLIADPIVNQDPSAGVICKIAEASAKFSRLVLNIKPRIALLSYSTRGSADGKSVDKMRIATKKAQSKAPEIIIDGELQLEAALSPEIAKIKAPDSPVMGKANILIFPNLDSANIGSRLIQFFGKARIIGPIIFGLEKPLNSLSSEANETDVYNLAIITQLQVKE